MNWLNEKLKQLITRYSSSQNLLVSNELITLSRKTLRKQVLIGRDISQFGMFDFSAVPNSKRIKALENQLTTFFNGESLGYSVAWRGGVAQVWFWDRAQVMQMLDQRNPSLLGAAFMSEVVYWEPPEKDGVYLYQVRSGCDLQWWRQGCLCSSHWFPGLPSEDDIKRFCRGHSMPPIGVLDVVLPISRDKYWVGISSAYTDSILEERSGWLRLFIATSIFILVLQLMSIFKIILGLHAVDYQLTRLDGATTELLSARTLARNNAAELKNIEEVMSVPNALIVQSTVMALLPQSAGLKLIKWERNINQVDFTLQGQITDTLSMVKAFEQKGITNVKVEPLAEANLYRFSMVIGETLENSRGQ